MLYTMCFIVMFYRESFINMKLKIFFKYKFSRSWKMGNLKMWKKKFWEFEF